MFTHGITYKWIGPGGQAIEKTNSLTAGQEINLDESIPDSSTDLLVALAFDKTKIKSIYLTADQNLTLEFNSGSVPAPSISLVANIPFVWQSNDGHANPFSAANVTALYVTNASGSAAQLQGRVLVDPT